MLSKSSKNKRYNSQIPQGTNFFLLECGNRYLFWILEAPLAPQGGSDLKKLETPQPNLQIIIQITCMQYFLDGLEGFMDIFGY